MATLENTTTHHDGVSVHVWTDLEFCYSDWLGWVCRDAFGDAEGVDVSVADRVKKGGMYRDKRLTTIQVVGTDGATVYLEGGDETVVADDGRLVISRPINRAHISPDGVEQAVPESLKGSNAYLRYVFDEGRLTTTLIEDDHIVGVKDANGVWHCDGVLAATWRVTPSGYPGIFCRCSVPAAWLVYKHHANQFSENDASTFTWEDFDVIKLITPIIVVPSKCILEYL